MWANKQNFGSYFYKDFQNLFDVAVTIYLYLCKTAFFLWNKIGYSGNSKLRFLDFLNFLLYFREFFNCQGLSIYHSENVSTPKCKSFERRIYTQTQDLQIFKKCNKSQMNPKEDFPNTSYSLLSSTTLHSLSLSLN